MTENQQDNFKVSEEAALWLHRLNHEDTPAVRAEFSAWIKKAAVNLEEFLFAQAVWKELDHVDPAARAGLESVVSSDSVIDLRPARGGENLLSPPLSSAPAASARTPARSHVPRDRMRWAIRIAASLGVILLGWLILAKLPGGIDVYATAVGDQRAIKLSDGSVIHLNTHSRAEVRYSEHTRTVRLVEGEALFTVAHDTARPFFVLTDSARIRAVGTQFDVYRASTTATRVAVVDGVVQVSSPPDATGIAPVASPESPPPAATQSTQRTDRKEEGVVRLAAGDQAEINLGRIVKTAAPNVQRAVAWRARRLMFPGDRVADIAEEFNRYNRIRIRVEGETIRERRMSGVFDADDPSPLVQFLARDPNVAVTKSADEILIRPRTATDAAESVVTR
jgi:transmembrane sensor